VTVGGRSHRFALVAALALAAVAVACSDSLFGPNEGGVRFVLSAGSDAFVSAEPRSAPELALEGRSSELAWHDDRERTRYFESANVTFASVLARDLDGALVDVDMDLPVTVDVVSMDGGRQVLLPDGVLPGATYDQIVVVMTAVQGVTRDGTTITIEPPGGGWTAIVPICPFTVDEGETTTVSLQFMLGQAFRWRDGRYRFRPRFVCDAPDNPNDDEG
jgi:hypothetical protein